jgi:uncharacterized membrane-anchored protein
MKNVLQAALVATTLALGTPVLAQPAAPSPAASAETAEQAQQRQFRELKWLPPGGVGQIDGKAQFKASAQYTFLDRADTDRFLRLNGNPPHGHSYTIAPVEGNWFGILSFADEGYIKDDEKIDADALLAQLQENNLAGNERKRKEGYDTLTLLAWAIPPRYDAETRRLEWGTRLRSDRDGTELVNVSTRLLGRSGYTSAVLVTTPATLEADLADFKKALKDFDYVSGEKYSEWREGDKVAAYGLGALVVGGAAAAASSKGGLKAILLAVAAGAAAVWTGAKRLLARRKSA